MKYSWSGMWYLKKNLTSQQGLVTAACVFVGKKLGTAAGGACAAVVNAWYTTVKNYVNAGIKDKRCLRIRLVAGVFTDFELMACEF